MRKLKSIKQLLEEFPDAEFLDLGTLDCSKWKAGIAPILFIYFGKYLSDEEFKDSTWDEQWFEPVKEKKLYAFKRDTGTNIVHCINEEEILGWKRCPEFDLTFKD